MSRTDTAARTIRATPQALYQALVTASALEEWMPPSGMTGEMTEFDPRPGGRYRMILRYDDPSISGKSGGNEDIAEARFVDLVPNERIVQEVDFASDDPRFQGTMTMSTTLTPLGDETEVRFTAENVPEGISAADHAEGMTSSLENLARFMAQNG
ncbi:MAG: SRPBCC domain-containing protein [Devosia sp.]